MLLPDKDNNGRRKKVLIVSPHPDDETFHMGGTALKLKRQGYDIHLLVMSFGEKSFHPVYKGEKLKKLRRDELMRVSMELGSKSVRFAGLPDTRIRSDDAYRIIKEAIRQIKPDRIYLPSNPDRHQDHLNTAQAGILAALQEDVREILCYDSFSSAKTLNYYEDISEFLDEKLRICSIFRTQIPKGIFSLDTVRARALTRGMEINTHAAEGFKVVRFVN